MLAQPTDRPPCKLCGRPLIGPRLDLGELPACNRFLSVYATPQTHPLAMAECTHCQLTQLAVYPPIDFVVPRVPWIRYREPDGHLDDVVSRLLPSLRMQQSRVMGVGPFDSPLLERFERHGLSHVLLDLLSMRASEDRAHEYPYLETLQSLLRPPELAAAAAKCGTASLIVCRYLLEHSHDPLATLVGLRHLTTPDGMVVVEVPDSDKFLSRADYSFVWEEHITYFSQRTLARLARRAGYEVIHMLRYEGALEDALVAVLKVASPDEAPYPGIGHDAQAHPGFFSTYQTSFHGVRDAWRSRLAGWVSAGRKIAVLGVGHQAVMFLNALGLQGHISLMLDDEPNKQGYFAPGISSPIVPSAALAVEPGVGVCLLAVSPLVEKVIRTKFAGLLECGVEMYSIFSSGAHSGALMEHRA